MMDEKAKQMVRDNLKKMKDMWRDKMEKMKMDDKKMDDMVEKAIKVADDMGLNAKDAMMLGKALKKVGMAMMGESDMKKMEW